MYELPGFIRAEALESIVADVLPMLDAESFELRRRHNIYFRDQVEGLAPDHPALRLIETVNHTLCADQLGGSAIVAL